MAGQRPSRPTGLLQQNWLGDLKASLSNFLEKLIYNASSSGKSVIGILPDGVNGRAVLHFIPVQKWKT